MNNIDKTFYDFKSESIPYKDIDAELKPLIHELNKIDGICTTSCCIGHNLHYAGIDFVVKDLETLYKFICNCLNSFTAFDLCVSLTDPTAFSIPRFYLKSKTIDLEYNKMICNNLFQACKKYNQKNENKKEKAISKNEYRLTNSMWKGGKK